MKRKASAKWMGRLKDGKGWVSSGSGAIREMPYSFATRFAEGRGTNPEELVGAAHAGCYSMALSAAIEREGFTPNAIETTATLSFANVDGNWTVTASHLDVEAVVPGLNPARFKAIADEAKATCPISRLLNAEISLESRLRDESYAESDSPDAWSPIQH